MNTKTYSRDAIERRRLLNRATAALNDGRLDADKFRSLTERHVSFAAPVGFDREPEPVQSSARKVQRNLFEP